MIYRSIDTKHMSAWDAVEQLDGELASGDDPIRYRGHETTPNDLRYLVPDLPAGQVRISYYGEVDGKCRLIRSGTLKRMVEDRSALRLKRYPDAYPELSLSDLRERTEQEFWKLLQPIKRNMGRQSLARVLNILETIKGENHA